MEICQPVQNTLSNLAQDLLSSPPTEFFHFLVYTVETATLAEFHGDGYRTSRLIHESAIVATDMLRGTILVEIELAHNLLLHVRVRVRSDDLHLSIFHPTNPTDKKSYLERKHRLPLLQLTSRHRAPSTLTQTPQLHNLLLFARSQPRLIIQILHVKGPALLKSQLIQISR